MSCVLAVPVFPAVPVALGGLSGVGVPAGPGVRAAAANTYNRPDIVEMGLSYVVPLVLLLLPPLLPVVLWLLVLVLLRVAVVAVRVSCAVAGGRVCLGVYELGWVRVRGTVGRGVRDCYLGDEDEGITTYSVIIRIIHPTSTSLSMPASTSLSPSPSMSMVIRRDPPHLNLNLRLRLHLKLRFEFGFGFRSLLYVSPIHVPAHPYHPLVPPRPSSPRPSPNPTPRRNRRSRHRSNRIPPRWRQGAIITLESMCARCVDLVAVPREGGAVFVWVFLVVVLFGVGWVRGRRVRVRVQVWALLGIRGPTASGCWWWVVVVRRLYAILVMIRVRLEMVLVLDRTSYNSSGTMVRMGG